ETEDISLISLFLAHPKTANLYTLSLHDALPIWRQCPCRTPVGRPHRRHGARRSRPAPARGRSGRATRPSPGTRLRGRRGAPGSRSEEHTSELQSRENLVCRLLLEKKKNILI